MTAPPTHPALAYAEVQLGVHKVYDEALQAASELDERLGDLDKAQDLRRALDQEIENLEMDLLIEERGKHPDHSEAAFARHLKEVHHKHDGLKMLKYKRNAAAGECAGAELDIDFIKSRIRIATARMEQLGGYLHYLAAVKQAEPPAQVVTIPQAETTHKPQETA